MYLTNRYFVHASTGGGVTYQQPDDDGFWTKHFVGGGRVAVASYLLLKLPTFPSLKLATALL